MAGRLQGRVAIVSGGATGVGGAASRLFAREGARVAVLDINAHAAQATVQAVGSAGGEAMAVTADVSQAAAVQQAVAQVVQRWGQIDVLFNHAGTIVVKPFLETTEEEWDRLMAINVKSMYLMTREVLPHMLTAGRGAIVCTSSISAVAGTPMEVLYDTTKGACHMFARAIAVEYRDRGIRCNAVCPGFIRTPHGQREVEALQTLGVDVSDAALAAAQGRMCEPEEVAAAALFLASDEASFINGAHLFVDNGFTAV
jgi:NAD(P)-dependent dehydrogenase (short-subunit alcohol dehydrogenase family)